MRILVTGHKGFVGSHVAEALEADGHDIVGLDKTPTFREWYNDMREVLDLSIDAIVHIGASSHSQSDDPDIYLWNSYASFLLARRASSKNADMPFVYFSSFFVTATENDWDNRGAYGWSKYLGEEMITTWFPYATILRPCVMWGDESMKRTSPGSLPFRLANHDLEYLITDWSRHYLHISDVCEAVKVSLEDTPAGTFNIHSDKPYTNKELAALTDWQGYQWTDKPELLGMKHIFHHIPPGERKRLPGWKPEAVLEVELPRLERKLIDVRSTK